MRILSFACKMCTRFKLSFSNITISNPHTSRGQLKLRLSTVSTKLNSDLEPPEHYLCSYLLHACLHYCRQLKNHHVLDHMPHKVAEASRASKVIHALCLKCGVGSKGSLGNTIVDLYAKCGNVEFAEKVFNRLDRRDVLAWNSLLSLYSRQGLLEQLNWSFGSMRSCGVFPNEFTYAMVSSVCARLKNVQYGTAVHCNVIKAGFAASNFCQGALIDMYAKCDCLEEARKVFELAVVLDTVSWTAMITGYVKCGMPDEALEVFDKMQKVGHSPDQVALITAINACISVGRLDDARELFSQMSNPNVVAWNVMISGHAQRGHEAVAIMFFLSMRNAGVSSSRSTLGSVLSAIASLGALDCGLLVHALALKLGLDSNIYVGSALINMYAKCEVLDAARVVFEAVDAKNVVMWNAMLGGYIQNDHRTEVINLFSNMRSQCVQSDEYTYTSILSACGCLEYIEMGRQLHSFIIKKDLSTNLFVCNALVDMYAKAGALQDARKQFELIKNRDNVSWNAIIVGYVQEEEEDEAFKVFRRMNLHGILPDEVSLASILSACANVHGLIQGLQVHCFSLKLGFETRLYAGSALIDMYAKCGAIRHAKEVYSRMPERSVASVNALIAGFSGNNVQEALDLFHEMQVMGLKPSEITYATLIDGCDRSLKLILGLQIHCLVVKRGLFEGDILSVSLLSVYIASERKTDAKVLFSGFSNLKSAILWTAMISGHAQIDCSEDALQIFQEMRKNDVLPDQATFASVLQACSILSSLKDGRQIHSLIFCLGFDLDELTSSALVDMYAKCGDVKTSSQVFEEMKVKNDVISWNSMIVGHAKNGYAELALEIFEEMKKTQIVPDDITFLGILTACSHSGKIFEGYQIFDLMINHYSIQPRADHYACMVDLLGRRGLLKEAEEFISNISVETDAKIWSTLLGACRIHGDEERGQRAAENLIKLEPQNSSPYVLLSNILSASGNWKEAKSLRKTMVEKEVKKMPGCSWIVIGERTNLFMAGDKSHSSSAEICDTLNYLSAFMKGSNHTSKTDHSLQMYV